MTTSSDVGDVVSPGRSRLGKGILWGDLFRKETRLEWTGLSYRRKDDALTLFVCRPNEAGSLWESLLS